MDSSKVRQYLRAHVLGLVAIFIALSGTAVAANDVATSAVVTDAKFKKLKKKVNDLTTLIATPASGDLTGTYPNLRIRPNVVSTEKLADNAVTSAKLADNAVTNAKVADNAIGTAEVVDGAIGQADVGTSAVGADELKSASVQGPAATSIASGASTRLDATCDGGEQALAFGGVWDSTDLDDASMSEGFIGPSGATVRGSNNDNTAHGFSPQVVCLDA